MLLSPKRPLLSARPKAPLKVLQVKTAASADSDGAKYMELRRNVKSAGATDQQADLAVSQFVPSFVIVDSINDLKKSMTERDEQLKKSMNDSINDLKKSMNERDEQLKKSMNDSINDLKKSMTERDEQLKKSINERVDQLKKSLDEKLDAKSLDEKLDAKLQALFFKLSLVALATAVVTVNGGSWLEIFKFLK